MNANFVFMEISYLFCSIFILLNINGYEGWHSIHTLNFFFTLSICSISTSSRVWAEMNTSRVGGYVSVLQFSVQRSVSSGDEIGTSSLRIELSAQFDSILSFDGREIQFFEWFLKTQTNLGICSLCPLTTLIEKIFLRLRLSTKMLFTILFFLLIPDTSETRLDDLLFGLLLCGMERVFYSRERKLSLAVNGKWWAMIFFYG